MKWKIQGRRTYIKKNEKSTSLSVKKAIEIAKTIYAIKAEKPKSKEVVERMLLLNDEQQLLAKLFDFF